MALKSYPMISGSMTKLRTEQIKSEDALGTLAGDLAALRGQVADIIGAEDYKENVSASRVQILDLGVHLDASGSFDELDVLKALKVSGAARVVGAAEIAGAVKMNSSLALTGSAELKSSMSVAGLADFNGGITANEIKIDGDSSVAGNLYLVGAAGIIADEPNLSFAAGKLSITGASEVSGEMKAGTIAMTGFTVDASGNMAAASVKDASLTSTHVVFAGAAGDLSQDDDFTFASDVLSIKGSTFGTNASVSGSLAVGGAADLNGALDVAGQVDLAASGTATNVRGGLNVAQNLTVTGDLIINGSTTTVNSTILTVDDINIELGSVATPNDTTASGGGIILKGATDKTILWNAAKGWEFNVKIEAPSAILAGDLAAVKGIFSGDVSGAKGTFSGDVSGVKGTFSGNVVITGSGVVVGQLNAFGGSALSGVVNLPARSGMKLLVTDAGKNVNETALSYADLGAGQVDLAVGSGAQQLHLDSGAKKLWSASDLTLSASAGVLTFADQTQSLKLSDDAAQWGTFRAADAAYGSATSLLGCFIAIDSRFDAIAAASAKKSVSTPSAAAADTNVAVSGPGSFTTAQLTVDNSMVYFNGQLLRSGSAAQVTSVAADYSLDGGYSAMKFSFAVEAGDVVVIQKV